MPTDSPHEAGTCPECGRTAAVNLDGTIRAHGWSTARGRRKGPCPGTGQRPSPDIPPPTLCSRTTCRHPRIQHPAAGACRAADCRCGGWQQPLADRPGLRQFR